jgi:hypothetical protein
MAQRFVTGSDASLGQRGRQQHMNYLHRHWRGELSLSVSFWINGVAVSIVFAIVGNIVDKLVELSMLILLSPLYDPTLYNSLVLVIAGLLSAIMIWLAVNVWQAVGVWRSATRYQHDPTHGWPWGNVAKYMVVIAVVALIIRTVQIVIEKNSLPIIKDIIAPRQPNGSGSGW